MYTADQVAEILNLHPKTVRKFIRLGRLKARKLGKQWRIMEKDLKLFLGDEAGLPGEDALLHSTAEETIEKKKQKQKIQVSSIVDIYVTHKDEAMRIANSLFAALNCKDPSYGEARCDHIFYEEESKARFIIWGGIKFVTDLLACISKITD